MPFEYKSMYIYSEIYAILLAKHLGVQMENGIGMLQVGEDKYKKKNK